MAINMNKVTSLSLIIPLVAPHITSNTSTVHQSVRCVCGTWQWWWGIWVPFWYFPILTFHSIPICIWVRILARFTGTVLFLDCLIATIYFFTSLSLIIRFFVVRASMTSSIRLKELSKRITLVIDALFLICTWIIVGRASIAMTIYIPNVPIPSGHITLNA